MNKTQAANSRRVQNLHEILFSLNIGFAVAFAVLTFTYYPDAPNQSARHFLLPANHLFLDAAAKVNGFLRLDRRDATGREIMAIALILGLATLIFLALRLIARTVAIRPTLYWVGGLVAFALVPALWIHALNATWISDSTLYPFWRSSQWSLFEVEVPLVCAFFFLGRKWSMPMWCGPLVLVVHYAWWTWQMWPSAHMPLWSARLFFMVFPCSGFAWLIYDRALKQSDQSMVHA